MSSTRDRRRHDSVPEDLHAPAATHERVLRVLGLSRRPLQSGELQNALGLVANETTRACAWLTNRGYISAVQRGRAAQQTKKAMGARGQRALVGEGTGCVESPERLSSRRGLVGTCGVKQVPDANGCIELGYAVLEQFHCRGIASQPAMASRSDA